MLPFLMFAGTDSKHFYDLVDFESGGIYRFAPLVLGKGELGRIHGVDERIGEKHYLDAVRFYARLLELLGQ